MQNDSLLAVQSEAFAEIVAPDAKLEQIADDLKFTEGPVWVDADGGYLLFSDIPGDRLYKWTRRGGLEVYREPSRNANGNTLDNDGRLITCEHSTRRVTRTDFASGEVEVLCDRHEGKRFNSPNDVVVKSDGTIWFTDPPYGTPPHDVREIDLQLVFRVDPERGETAVVASDFDMPNGLCFSPDERRLYIADSGKPKHIRLFDVAPDGSLSGGEVFCEIDEGVPDGIRCDETGRLFSSAGDGVHVFDSSGELLGKILVPETPANLCFGDPDRKKLFMTARTGLYAIELKVCGAK